jgi:ribosomal protein S7
MLFIIVILVSLLITRILKSGKKTIAKKIVYQAFDIIKKKQMKIH